MTIATSTSYGNYGMPRAERPQVGVGINTNKLMRTNEVEVHSALSAIIKVTEDYKKTGDFEFLKKYLETIYNRLGSEKAALVGDFKYNIDKFLKICAEGNGTGANVAAAEKFLDIILHKRKPLEVKYLKKIMKGENGDETVKRYLSEKSSQDLQSTIWSVLEDYAANRTPENMERYNKILRYAGKKIVKIPLVQASQDEKLVPRFAFEGAFVFPTIKDREAGAGYSTAYSNFLQNATPRHPCQIKNEDFYANKTVQAMQQSENMAKLLPQLKEQLQKQGIDKDLMNQCNIYDFALVLYNAYGGKGKTPMSNELFAFSSINSECTEGTRQTFWKEFAKNKQLMDTLVEDMKMHGVDENFIHDLVQSIRENGTVTIQGANDPRKYKQPTPKLTVHHKVNIKDAGAMNNIMDVDSKGNYTAYVDYYEQDKIDGRKNEKSNHDLQHIVDANLPDGTGERLVDLQDGVDGKNLILSCGIRNNYYVKEEHEDRKDCKRKTYLDMAQEYGVGRA